MLTNIILSVTWIIGLVIGIIYQIFKYIFVYLYGEEIRLLIINMPEYQPTWFATVGLNKPIRFWHLVRINFFVIRLSGVVFTKQKSLINEEFKSKLSKDIICYLKILKLLLNIGGILILIPSIILFFFYEH